MPVETYQVGTKAKKQDVSIPERLTISTYSKRADTANIPSSQISLFTSTLEYRILQDNPYRLGAIINNPFTTSSLLIRFGLGVSATNGFRVPANTPILIGSSNLYTGPVTGMTSAGTAVVDVIEI